jgi:hypothetical protein
MKPIFALTGLFLLMAIPSCSQTGTDWQPLFGEDYAGADFVEGSWEIRGDVIIAHEDQVIWAEGEYEDFKLALEFMNDTGTNSGIIVYCTDQDNWIPNSVEVQIADDHYEEWGSGPKYAQCGAIYGHLPATEQKVVREPGQWNSMEITCRGQRIEVVLNGKKVTDMDMAQWTSGTVNPDGSPIPEWLPKPFANLPTRGSIGLQGKHGEASIRFRNVKIASL